MNISNIVVLVLAILAAPALAENEDAADSVGIPDPAAVYCSDLGYDYEGGNCIFPDGSSCLAWDFYWGKCGQSFTYCEQQGYTIKNRVEDVGTWTGEYAVCVFNDCSECEEQDYFDGDCEPSECRLWTIKDGCTPPVEFAGLISKTARINNSAGQSAEDVLGWDVIYRGEDGTCYSYYVAQAPLIGMTEPVEIECPLGVQAFDSYMVDFEDAIAVMQMMDCGSIFVELSLYWPLTPEVEEPEWHITTDIGCEIVIGANCGKPSSVAAE